MATLLPRRLPLVLVFGFTSLGATSAFAQAPAPPPPPPKHEISAEAAFVGVSGNAASNTFGLGAEIIARPEKWVFRHKLSFVRNEAGGTVNSQAFLYNPRAERSLNARISVFGDYAYFRDRFAGVANRNVGTGGVSIKVVNTARQTFAADLGAGYLNETRLAGANVSTAVYTVGTAYKLKLSSTADVTDDLALLGDVKNSTDFRITHGVAVTAKLAAGLSLKVGNIIRYAHFPAPGFKTTDVITSVALVAKFPSKK